VVDPRAGMPAEPAMLASIPRLPLFLGIDTHALSESAFASALEVLALPQHPPVPLGGQYSTDSTERRAYSLVGPI
jgi:hypothetical protein